MPSDPELVEIHRDLLALFKEIHLLCTQNNIDYSLHGGTLLGAIREKGFIPWDNDGDISMMRDEYNKLCVLVKNEDLPENITIETNCRIPRFTMRKNGTTTAFVDIFIYDYVTKNPIGIKVKFWMNFFLRSFVEDSVNFNASKMRKFYKSWMYALFGFFQKVGRILPDGFALRMFTAFNVNCFHGKRQYIVRSNDGYRGMQNVLPAKVMKGFEIVPFEETELAVSSCWDEVLVHSYGEDYMIPKKSSVIEIQAHNEMRNNM